MSQWKQRSEAIDFGDGPETQTQGMEMAVAKWVGEFLNRHYPGHPWRVEVDIQPKGGVVKVQLGFLMPADRWYVWNVNDVIHDPGGRKTIMKGAGEILERYQLPRGRYTNDDWRSAMNRNPVHGRGHLAPLL